MRYVVVPAPASLASRLSRLSPSRRLVAAAVRAHCCAVLVCGLLYLRCPREVRERQPAHTRVPLALPRRQRHTVCLVSHKNM